MRKIYLGFVAETELNGCTILPEYFFETRAFTTYEKARDSLDDWVNEVIFNNEGYEALPEDEKHKDTLIVEVTKTSWGEDWVIPHYRCWIEEKELEV